MKALSLALAAALALALPAAAGPSEDAAANRVVMMVHAHLEPAPPLFVPPLGEAIAATPQDGKIAFHVIPYSIDTGRPLRSYEARLDVVDAFGVPTSFAPNAAPQGRATCEAETGLPGHEGSIEACLVFLVDASFFEGRNVVTLVLHAEDADEVPFTETYNAAAHGMLHSWMEGAPVTLEQANSFSEPTPFVVEHAVDPVA